METLAIIGRTTNTIRNAFILLIIALSAIILLFASGKLVQDFARHDEADEKKQENYIKASILVLMGAILVYVVRSWWFQNDTRAALSGASNVLKFV
jgi:TRAP-type C4-dicarboxylate transport system permease small subunit